MHSIGEWWMWAGFVGFVLIMLALDLYAFGGKKAHKMPVREALAWSILWFTLAMLFSVLLWWYLDGQAGREVANVKTIEFLTGYLIEKSLSVDNVFVFVMIFGYFAVSPEYQRRVLLYGVLGAIVMRAIMIIAGVWLVQQFTWVLYLFGAFLVLIEVSDVVFAVDSIPAIFAITTDPFIVFTSNILAIMGLRALYFLLADMNDRLHLLKYGLALILVFVGAKMLLSYLFQLPVWISLSVVGAILVTAAAVSLLTSRPGHNKKNL